MENTVTMNFSEVLYKLYDMTEKTVMFAMPSYGEDVSIGLRRECIYSILKDPVIGGQTFMLSGDVYKIERSEKSFERIKINRISDLWVLDSSKIEIQLRASTNWPYTEVHLGHYQLKSKAIKKYNEFNIPEVLRLEIERKTYG